MKKFKLEQYYDFLFQKSYEDNNKNLLYNIPEKYLPYGYCAIKNYIEGFTNEKELNKIIKSIFIDKNERDIRKFFIMAIQHNDSKCVKGFICLVKELNLDINKYLSYIDANSLPMVRYFLEKGADIHYDNDYCLLTACADGNLRYVKYLIKHGANINAERESCLTISIANNHFNVVKCLIEHGANIKICNRNVTFFSIYNNNLEMLKFLIAHGADIHYNNNEPLEKAKYYGSSDIINYLSLC